MTSEPPPSDHAFVWVWLPGATRPVVAARLVRRPEGIRLAYGRSYLDRPEAISLYEPELPLRDGLLPLPAGLSIPNSIRDAAPDAWGRRVILNRKFGAKGSQLGSLDLDELTFLLESGSDRIGALDFQASATQYVPRASHATLEELVASANKVERNIPLSPELDQALHHGSSIGGARPKALITDGDRKMIAKFSSTSDTYGVVKAEFVAMRLAAHCGLDVAPVELTRASGRDVLLVERFDRGRANAHSTKRMMVSALKLLGLDELMARYASYEDFAEIVRHRFTAPTQTLHELFGRIVFNILVGNTDDHARNHAAFWSGSHLALTPAYDICPQSRAGQETGQVMLIRGQDRSSRIETALTAAPSFHLSDEHAINLIKGQIRAIVKNWAAECDAADMGEVDRNYLWRRQFLNPFAFSGLRPTANVLLEELPA